MTIENIFLEELRRVISERPRGYQTEIATALKINTSTFSNMVCGRRGWDEEERRAVASYVGIDYEDMARRTTPTKHIQVIGDPINSLIDIQGNTESAVTITHTVTGQPQSGKRVHELSEKEEEALLLFRKYGNPALLDECVDRLRRVRDILTSR